MSADRSWEDGAAMARNAAEAWRAEGAAAERARCLSVLKEYQFNNPDERIGGAIRALEALNARANED